MALKLAVYSHQRAPEASHLELTAGAERLALARLAAVDADEVAETIEWTLRGADADPLAHRAGRVRGRSYVDVNEAASEILEDLLQPELDDRSVTTLQQE